MFQRQERVDLAIPENLTQDLLEKTFTNEFLIGKITIGTCEYTKKYMDKLDIFSDIDKMNSCESSLPPEWDSLSRQIDERVVVLQEQEEQIVSLQKALNDVPFSDGNARVEIYKELTRCRGAFRKELGSMSPTKNRIHQLAIMRMNSQHVKVHDFVLRLIEMLHDPATGVSDFESGPYASITSADIMQNSIQKRYNKLKLKDKTFRLSKDTLRVIRFDDLIRACASFPMFRQAEMEYDETIKLVTAFIFTLDGFLYNSFPTQYVKTLPDGTSKLSSITYVMFDFLEDAQESGVYNLDAKSFPLIEKPIDWTKDEIGGYIYSTKTKPTKKLGAGQQPEFVLDGLNSLQDNKYTLAKHVSVGDYRKFLTRKFTDKFSPNDEPEEILVDKIRRMVANTTASFDYVTRLYEDNRPFYFEFMYDFRGRAYSTGYDINLQADKYKKAMIIPHADNFQADCYFADTKQIETLKGLLDD